MRQPATPSMTPATIRRIIALGAGCTIPFKLSIVPVEPRRFCAPLKVPYRRLILIWGDFDYPCGAFKTKKASHEALEEAAKWIIGFFDRSDDEMDQIHPSIEPRIRRAHRRNQRFL